MAHELDAMSLILMLCQVPGLGRKAIERILLTNHLTGRTEREFLRLSPDKLSKEYKLSPILANRVSCISTELEIAAAKCGAALHQAGVMLLLYTDLFYPRRLTSMMASPPPFLFAYGNLGALQAQTFMVANSNDASEIALNASDEAASEATISGMTVVTGHNRIPYQRPALVARRNGGRICYVLDRGLIEAFGGDFTRDLFPAARIWSPTYDPETDLTLSPFSPSHHGIAANNRYRDEIIFALADTVIVGEIRKGGVMEKFVQTAVERGQKISWIMQDQLHNSNGS